MTQKPCRYNSGCHTVDVNVCWMQIIKNADCVDEYNIYYWKKLTESQSRVSEIKTLLLFHVFIKVSVYKIYLITGNNILGYKSSCRNKEEWEN